MVFGPAAGASMKVAAHAALEYGPALSSVSLASVLAKEAWKRIPSWIKEDVSFPGSRRSSRKSKGGKGEDGDDDGDEDTTEESTDDMEMEMASLTAVVQKLQSLAAVGSEKLAQDDSIRLTGQQLQAAVLAYIQLASQLRQRQPAQRDLLYQNINPNNIACNIGSGDDTCSDSDDHETASEIAPASLPPDQSVDWSMLKEMLDFAVWAYDEDTELLRSKLEAVDYYLLQHCVVAPHMPPGYVGHYMALNPEKKVLMIGIKGTSTLEDMLTDCCGLSVAFELDAGACPFPEGHAVSNEDIAMQQQLEYLYQQQNGSDDTDTGTATTDDYDGRSSIEVCRHNGLVIRCHEGILISARRLADEIMPLLLEQEATILQNGAYQIIICGHSLGAAAASLLAIILRSRMPSLVLYNNLHVYSFASPPVLDHDAALACTSFTTTIVNNSDFIPRSSMANVRSFLQFLQVVHQKLVQRGMGLDSPNAAIQLIRKLSRGTGGDLLMTQEEVTEAMAMAHDRIGLVDPQHLYVPGRVIVMYENWNTRNDANSGDGNSRRGDCNGKEANTGATDDTGGQRNVNIEHSVVSDGTMKALRFFEIDKARMITDHLTASYYKSVNALVSKQQMLKTAAAALEVEVEVEVETVLLKKPILVLMTIKDIEM
jgi:hypothetical protein